MSATETLNSIKEAPPQPSPDEDSIGFWRALENGELAVCRCQDCRVWLHPPLERCPKCFGPTAFEKVAGTGEVYSFIVVYQPALPGYRDKLPYIVTLVELDEQKGLRIPSRIVGAEPGDVKCGMRVTAEVEALPGGDYNVVVFRPV